MTPLAALLDARDRIVASATVPEQVDRFGWFLLADLAATCDPATYIAAVKHAEAAVGGAG